MSAIFYDIYTNFDIQLNLALPMSNLRHSENPPPENVTKHNHVKILTCNMTHIIILTLCESFLPIAYELLFRHIFETQIHIQTQIRKN